MQLHKLFWLVANDTLFCSNDDKNGETYEYSMLAKNDVGIDDLDWFIQLEHTHGTYGILAYEQLYPEESYMCPAPINQRSFGNWFVKEDYLEAVEWVKNNRTTVFNPNFCDFMQVFSYDGNSQEHLSFLHKVSKLLNDEVIHLHFHDKRKEAWVTDKIFLGVNCSDTFYMACSDSETFDKDDIDTIIQLQTMFGYEGLIALVSSRRNNQQPLFDYAKLNVERYIKAVNYLIEKQAS